MGVQGGGVWVSEVGRGGCKSITVDCKEVEKQVWSEGNGVGRQFYVGIWFEREGMEGGKVGNGAFEGFGVCGVREECMGRVEELERQAEEIWDGFWRWGLEVEGVGYVPLKRMEADRV